MLGGGKFNEDDVGRQQKKKTIFTTAHPFPYLNNRIQIISMEEVQYILIQSPSSIDWFYK